MKTWIKIKIGEISPAPSSKLMAKRLKSQKYKKSISELPLSSPLRNRLKTGR